MLHMNKTEQYKRLFDLLKEIAESPTEFMLGCNCAWAGAEVNKYPKYSHEEWKIYTNVINELTSIKLHKFRSPSVKEN